MAGERTAPASPRKLRRARSRGQVWRSQDLSAAAVLVTAAGVLAWQGQVLFSRLRALMEHSIRAACSPTPPPPGPVLEAALSTVALCLAPIALSALAAAAVAGLIQVGPLWTLAPLKPDLGRLDPVAGLRKLFSSRALVTLALSLGKLLVVALVLVWTIGGDLRDLGLLARAAPATAVAATGELIGALLIRGALALAGLSLIDVLYQRHRYLLDQRMTRQEVDQEQRETEGDGSQKGERRRLHRELAEQALLSRVGEARVVVTDPERLAVALGYDPGQEAAPEVLARGRDLLALEILEIARRVDVPVRPDPALARRLVRVEVGEAIPEALDEAVAAILRGVMDDGQLGE